MVYDCKELRLKGVWLLTPPMFADQRGSMVKPFHRPSFLELGLDCDFNETLISESRQKDVLRGFHFQVPPYAQAKMMYCVKGSVRSVLLDVRVGSPTYGQTESFLLSNQILYIPVGIGNCYVVQEPDTVILYHLTSAYAPDCESGIRFDSIPFDFGAENPIVSKRDLALPKWQDFVSPFMF